MSARFWNDALELRKRFVPKSNEMHEVEVVNAWTVRWYSRHGEYAHNTRPEVEVFPSKKAAEDFADSLRLAFSLIRHTSGTKVSVMRSDK